MKTKFIFVTGGVVSSLGKGIMASSVGQLLKKHGFKVTMQKFEPYINVNTGIMSPAQHGEIFVTNDGAETDLDLGHYERFLDENLTKYSSVSSGDIYASVIEKEKKGVYKGATIQVIPHITEEIKNRLKKVAQQTKANIVITEIGGTVGDIESLPFLEAIRQTRKDFGYKNTLYIHTTLLPLLKAANEIKTKPTQHSVKELMSLGISPDMIVLRSEEKIGNPIKEKISLFCDVPTNKIFESVDVDIIYEMILNMKQQKIDEEIMKHFRIKPKVEHDLTEWESLIEKIKNLDETIKVAIVGEYVSLNDAYLSVFESLKHAGFDQNVNVEVVWLDSKKLTKENIEKRLEGVKGILVPGGFGSKGIEGKILAIEYARVNNVPFLGICLGLQLTAIEYARNVLGIKGATSREFFPHTKYAIVDSIVLPISKNRRYKQTQKLGLHAVNVVENTLIHKIYNRIEIKERHRHGYEINLNYKEDFEKSGLVFSAYNKSTNSIEALEYPKNDFFVAVQYHPEFLSRPLKAHPLFIEFLKSIKKNKHHR